MPDFDFIKLIGVMKTFFPLMALAKDLPTPIQSYSEPQPKQIDLGGKIEYAVITKISYAKADDAKKLIEFYNSIDQIIRKLAK